MPFTDLFKNFQLVVQVLASGFVTTVWITLGGFVLSLVVGSVLAMMHVSPAPPAQWAARVYTQFFCNIPLLAVLVVFYFGFTEIGIGRDLDAWVWAIIGLGVYTGAFVGETLRSGINAIPLGQAEAARSIGLTFGQSLRAVILPQAFRTVIPPLGSLLTALVKNSALALVVGVNEIAGQARFLISEKNGEVSIWTVIIGVVLCYLIINIPISYLIRYAELRTAMTR